jgi:hypothetical protein
MAVLTHGELAPDFGTLRQAQIMAPASPWAARDTPHRVAVNNRPEPNAIAVDTPGVGTLYCAFVGMSDGKSKH